MTRERRNKPMAAYAYIGAGNKFSVITRKARPPFERIKTIYGEEHSKLIKNKPENHQPQVTKIQRADLKKKVEDIVRSETRVRILTVCLSILITLVIFGIVYYLL